MGEIALPAHQRAARAVLPTISFDALWHVGTLDPADKGCNGESHEGRGLSVSTCPDSWIEIHRLGGLPVWELAREGNRFLDFHALTPAQRAGVAAWCEREGFAVPGKAWEAAWRDAETEDVRWTLHDVRAEAEAQIEEESEASVTEVDVHRPTDLMQAFVGRKVDPVEMPDHMAAAYAALVLDIDGVWWEDEHDPERLSAPRGVIFPERLSAWSRTAPAPAADAR